MKQGWEIKKLGEVCEINPSKKEAIKKLELNDKVSFLPMEDLGINAYYITPSQERLLSEVLSSYTYFADGDVLLAKVSPCFENGKIGIANNLTNGVGFGSSEYLTFRLGKDVIKEFLYFYLQNKTFVKEATKNLTGTSGLRRVPKSFVESCIISVPPISEQERIVEELNCLSGVIEKKREQLRELDALAESIFYTMFGDPITNEKGWEVDRLGNLCEISSSKRIYAHEYCDNGIPFYRGKEISEKSKGNDISVELYISEERYNELKNKFGVPQIGDILLTAVGTIGNIWVVDSCTPFYFKDGNVLWLQAKENINPIYFKTLLYNLIDKYKESMANGCAYSALTIVNLKEMKTNKVPYTLQQEFADKIALIEKQKQLIKESIAQTEELFNSRMAYYFN